MAITFYFVRHGNTYWNQSKRTQGHQHNELNETGFKQAEAAAERLAQEGVIWDALYTSDLLRTRQTAKVISNRLGLPISGYDKRLRERGQGDTEGTLLEERIEMWGEDWRKLDLGQEPLKAVRERGMDFVREMAVKHDGGQILAVSHGILLRELIREMLQDEEAVDKFENTSVTIVKGDLTNGWECTLYNCSKHLPDHLQTIKEGAAT